MSDKPVSMIEKWDSADAHEAGEPPAEVTILDGDDAEGIDEVE